MRPITASGTGSVLTVAKAGASSSTRRNWRTTFDLTLRSGTWVRAGSSWPMVAKCANPPCFARFRYLGEGRLFRLEADPAFRLSDNPTFGSSKIVEYFWLCDACSTSMTLRLDEKGTVTAEPLSEPAPANPRDFAIISRHKCMLLRTVSTTRGRA